MPRILNRCPVCEELLELRQQKNGIILYCLKCNCNKGKLGSKTWEKRVRKYNGETKQPIPKRTLHELKTMAYDKYLKSGHWTKIKKAYYKKHKKICYCCECPSYVLHHITYENRGEEKDEDLLPLCEDCHNEIHNLIVNKEDGVTLKNGHEVLKSLIDMGAYSHNL